MPSKARELATTIFAWQEAKVDPITISMRLANVNRRIYRQAMRIVSEELIPEQSARDVDEEFKRRGRYATEDELRERRAALEGFALTTSQRGRPGAA